MIADWKSDTMNVVDFSLELIKVDTTGSVTWKLPCFSH
jgi:hypothetical protein